MKNIKAVIILSVLALLMIVFASCEFKREAIGSQNKIIVIADSTLWLEIEEQVRGALEQELYTPQPEPIFTVTHRLPESLNKLTRFPNLLILGTLQAEGRMGDIMNRVLSEESVERVKQDSAFLFSKRDAWAKNQMLAVAVAPDLQTLKERWQTNGDKVFDVFDEFTRSVVFTSIFQQFEQKDLERKLMREHGWTMRMQHDYFLAVDSSEINLVWLRRFNPQRWISVHWQPTDDPSLLSKEWMLEQRQWIGEEIYQGDYVYEDSLIQVREKIVDFNGRYAIRLDGVWQNEEFVMGGPFRSYGFYNEGDSRLYFIDLAVFAPGERKYQYIRQLDAIASTFRTRQQTGAE